MIDKFHYIRCVAVPLLGDTEKVADISICLTVGDKGRRRYILFQAASRRELFIEYTLHNCWRLLDYLRSLLILFILLGRLILALKINLTRDLTFIVEVKPFGDASLPAENVGGDVI